MTAAISKVLFEYFKQTLTLEDQVTSLFVYGFHLVAIILIAIITDFIARKVLLGILHQVTKKSKTTWDDILVRKNVFSRLAHVVPAYFIQIYLDYSLEPDWALHTFLHNVINIYILFVIIRSISGFLNGIHEIYQTLEIAKQKPIKSYIQVGLIIVYFVGGIIILSIIFNKDITDFFTGLTAIAAVLMLVFKDSILGLVGGIQLTENDMIRPGDWIEMPSRKADGDVIEINLHTVKVQNWDKTITTIPTYAMVSESFINWRGMQDSSGRRIKRAIHIDMTSVKFCSVELLEKFKKIHFLKEYIESKQAELQNYNTEKGIDDSVLVNGRRLTNIGVFRKYLESYLHENPNINLDMTFLVRQLKPTDKGLPIEIYVFSNDKNWVVYESIQADIFDHILAVIPEFELSVFQHPSGADFHKLVK